MDTNSKITVRILDQSGDTQVELGVEEGLKLILATIRKSRRFTWLGSKILELTGAPLKEGQAEEDSADYKALKKAVDETPEGQQAEVKLTGELVGGARAARSVAHYTRKQLMSWYKDTLNGKTKAPSSFRPQVMLGVNTSKGKATVRIAVTDYNKTRSKLSKYLLDIVGAVALGINSKVVID